VSKKALWTTIPSLWKRHAEKLYSKAVAQYVKKPKRIARRTPKRAKEERIYRARVKVWLVGRVSQISGDPAQECHHKFGKRGRLLLWEPGWVPVTHVEQTWIHTHPDQAGEAGLLGPEGTWNDYDRAVKFVAIQVEVKPENCLVTAASLLEKTK